MVVLNRIYTGSGDQGETALGDGSRTGKSDPRVEAYGSIDETNAALGLASLHCPDEIKTAREMKKAIARIQNDLFDVGADLSVPYKRGEEPGKRTELRVLPEQTERLEQEIDEMNSGLAPLRSFVIPGGSNLAATLHMARTIARRAERAIAALLLQEETVNPECLRYVNRLSDWLFVAARIANANGSEEILWEPGKNRE